MNFSLTVPVQKNDYMLAVRLAVGAVCEANGFDIDSAEDFKVCVNESILILQRSGFQGVNITFAEEDGLKAVVRGVDKKQVLLDEIENEISYALLGALVDNAEIKKNDGVAEEILLFKGL